MKKRFFAMLLVLVLAVYMFVSCGEKKTDRDRKESEVPSTDTLNVSGKAETEAPVIYKIEIGGNDISLYNIVLGDKTEEVKLVGELLAERIKTLTGIEPAFSEEETERFIKISSVDGDTFGVRVDGGNMYIICPTEDGAYAAVAAALEESLFDTADAVNDVISVADGFDVSGNCGDYIIGDNEFNPFD